MRNVDQTKIEARYRTLLILWVAQMTSIGFFLLVALFAGAGAERPPVPDKPVLSFALAALGTFTAIISFVVRSKLLRESVEKQDQKLVQSALVVGCALCEVPALLGVMAKFTLPGKEFWLLFAISAVTMALHVPRKANLLAASYKDPSFGASV